MASQNQMRSTVMYAFAATTPAPPKAPGIPQDLMETPEIEVSAEERPSLLALSDEPDEARRTYASVPPPPGVLLPRVGDVVGGHYKLMRPLGEGTFGRVYVAQRIDVKEHQVALKIMPRSLYVGRNVDRELVMLATVGHPNVVQLKDHGTTDEYVWLTMPVYQGETLAERLDRGSLSLKEAYDIFVPIAFGLLALHDAGLRHQDIKPENIYLATFGGRLHPVLLDLGVAAEKEATFIAGTALYASPEQIFALDKGPMKVRLSEKMDTYSLGATLLVSLVGPKHFPGESAQQPAELALAHATRATTPVHKDALPDLSGEPRKALSRVLAKWLSLEPDDRPSMREVASELDVLLMPEREAKAKEAELRERQKASLLRIRIAAGGLLLGALAIGAVIFANRETLKLANELERARSEGAASFDKLDTCVASHKIASAEADSCKKARESEADEFKRSLAAFEKKGTGSEAERAREMQNLVGLYSTKLKTCEEGADTAQKACTSERERLTSDAAKREKELTIDRDLQKGLVESRTKEVDDVRAERDSCNSARATCVEERSQCIDQRAQCLIACAGGAPKVPGPAGPTGPAPGPAAPSPSPAAPGPAPASPDPSPAPAPPPAPAPAPPPAPAPAPSP